MSAFSLWLIGAVLSILGWWFLTGSPPFWQIVAFHYQHPFYALVFWTVPFLAVWMDD
jgi:hypothetical protein